MQAYCFGFFGLKLFVLHSKRLFALNAFENRHQKFRSPRGGCRFKLHHGIEIAGVQIGCHSKPVIYFANGLAELRENGNIFELYEGSRSESNRLQFFGVQLQVVNGKIIRFIIVPAFIAVVCDGSIVTQGTIIAHRIQVFFNC